MRRDPSAICVVQEPKDIQAIEGARVFRGRYHVLGGVIDPIHGVGPDQLNIASLMSRLADGTVTVFDNAWRRSLPPRAVRFEIDPDAGTATRVEEITDPAIAQALCCGSARRLPGGEWVVSWGSNPTVGAYGPDGARRLALTFGSFFTYRADAVVGRVTAAELRAGMDAQHPR